MNVPLAGSQPIFSSSATTSLDYQWPNIFASIHLCRQAAHRSMFSLFRARPKPKRPRSFWARFGRWGLALALSATWRQKELPIQYEQAFHLVNMSQPSHMLAISRRVNRFKRILDKLVLSWTNSMVSSAFRSSSLSFKAYFLSGAFDCLDVKEPLTGGNC